MIVAGRIRMASSVPGASRRCEPSEKAQAARMTKAGLTNSDGCSVTLPMFSQRCAPFTSGPNCNAANTSSIETR